MPSPLVKRDKEAPAHACPHPTPTGGLLRGTGQSPSAWPHEHTSWKNKCGHLERLFPSGSRARCQCLSLGPTRVVFDKEK